MPLLKILPFRKLAPDLSATSEACSLFHAEHLSFDVAIENGFLLQLAAVGSDGALYFSVELHFASFDVTFDVGVLTDGDLALIRVNLTVDLAVDDHIVRELDRAIDLDALGEDVGCVSHYGGESSSL